MLFFRNRAIVLFYQNWVVGYTSSRLTADVFVFFFTLLYLCIVFSPKCRFPDEYFRFINLLNIISFKVDTGEPMISSSALLTFLLVSMALCRALLSFLKIMTSIPLLLFGKQGAYIALFEDFILLPCTAFNNGTSGTQLAFR